MPAAVVGPAPPLQALRHGHVKASPPNVGFLFKSYEDCSSSYVVSSLANITSHILGRNLIARLLISHPRRIIAGQAALH